MKKIRLIVGIIILLITCVFFIANKITHVSSLSESRFLMDTEFTITLYGSNLKKAKEESFKLLAHIEKLTDPYRSYSEIPYNLYNLNNDPSTKAIVLDEDLYLQLKKAYTYYTLTRGEYNIGIFNLVNLWKAFEKENRLPAVEEIDRILKASSLSEVEFKDEDYSIKRDATIKFDLGSVAKGYSIAKVCELLKGYSNVRGAIINGGGNIKVLGQKSLDKPIYNIGIQDPDNLGKIIGTTALKGGDAISTSGSYQRYYAINKIKYSHILSGTTGFPPTYFKSITVITKDGTQSDILSTILYLLSLEEGREFLKFLDFKAEALWIDNDNVIYKSDGFVIDMIKGKNKEYKYEK